ncbi:hypothetical protein NC652_003554 [Populus alba x Populus x berolinensis]|nr:hypothetical protein NC652_003554 [Populus alba x Populus x berolinensis]
MESIYGNCSPAWCGDVATCFFWLKCLRLHHQFLLSSIEK